jgi:exodeoxyribonuclease VII large subunit
LTKDIKSILESEFQSIWVEGEISNYLFHTSGHRYFTLKDATAQIKAVIWRFSAQNLKVEPKDGLKVRVFGDITLYEKGGYYQIRVLNIFPLGIGTLEQQFQRHKEKLNSEGLFDSDRKRPVPGFPSTIGIVTSPTGAAIRDIVHICRRRAPVVRLILRPAKVQGEGAAEDIVQAIEEFNRLGGVDLLIVGRGGGSLEDLWAFNEEIVARAIFGSRIPVISAVGHEIDFTIADFVADLRAPTPSAAAELATFDAAQLAQSLVQANSRLSRALERSSESLKLRLRHAFSSVVFRKPESMLERIWQRFDDQTSRLTTAISNSLNNDQKRFDLLTGKLDALSPEKVLNRGYAIVRRHENQQIILDAASLKPEERVDIRFSRGERTARIE